jgi:ribonucleoside-diphosphate reductase alpha chain
MEKYFWLNKESRKFLSKDYLLPGVTPEQRIREIAETAEKILGIEGYADKLEDYVARGFISFSTPVWTNFGNDRGYPVSCFGSFIPDDMEKILDKAGEVGMMTKKGGGTSGYFGALRHRGAPIKNNGESSGPVHFMELFDKTTSVISQGSARRGQFAAYLPIDHPDIEEFLLIGDEGQNIKEMNFGVTISDKWMKEMLAGDKPKQEVWAKVLNKRFSSGYPYIFFSDTINNKAPEVFKDYPIYASNLCSEICLPSNEDLSFVCVLCSMNLFTWDLWKDTDAVKVAIKLLDAVNQEFVEKTKGSKYMVAARNFAEKFRALGLGGMGWHSYLQSHMIAFESMEAKLLNTKIWKFIREQAEESSKELAALLGEPEGLKGTGRRNATLLAIAPTKSTSTIYGSMSQGIEPYMSVYHVKPRAKGKEIFKNPIFKAFLKEKGRDTRDVWESILIKGGSVKHLDFMTDEEKEVFKSFAELSQKEIVIQAIGRQKYLDQSQSLNLRIPQPKDKEQAKVLGKMLSELLVFGWEGGIKTYYYQFNSSPTQELIRAMMECTACEG